MKENLEEKIAARFFYTLFLFCATGLYGVLGFFYVSHYPEIRTKYDIILKFPFLFLAIFPKKETFMADQSFNKRPVILGILLVLFTAGSFVGYFLFATQGTKIPDVTKSTTLTLSIRPLKTSLGFKNVHKLTVHVSGQIDGMAEISYTRPGTGVVTKKIRGRVDLPLVDGDWYSPTFQLNYTPKGVKKGNLTIHYKFYTL